MYSLCFSKISSLNLLINRRKLHLIIAVNELWLTGYWYCLFVFQTLGVILKLCPHCMRAWIAQFCGRKLTDRLVEVHNDANGDTIKYVNAIESMLGKIIYSNVWLFLSTKGKMEGREPRMVIYLDEVKYFYWQSPADSCIRTEKHKYCTIHYFLNTWTLCKIFSNRDDKILKYYILQRNVISRKV